VPHFPASAGCASAPGLRQQLVELLQEGTVDDVYRIELAMFPVTSIKREKEK